MILARSWFKLRDVDACRVDRHPGQPHGILSHPTPDGPILDRGPAVSLSLGMEILYYDTFMLISTRSRMQQGFRRRCAD
jgi:hypothetical protein